MLPSNQNLGYTVPKDEPADTKLYQSAIGSLLYVARATRPDIAQAVGSNPVATPLDSNQNLGYTVPKDEPADTKLYQSAIGSLLYVARATRPDIAQAVGILCQFCSKPNKSHWTAAKRVMRYLREALKVNQRNRFHRTEREISRLEYRNKHQSMPIVQMVTAVSKIWTKLSTKQKKMYISKKVVKHANVVPTPRSIRKNHTLRKMNSLLRKPWQRSTPILRDVESFTGTSSSQDSSYLKSDLSE
ncbi:hypothetical protein QE152_g23611 [Popillia japonica]|uniref:Uncharacterized protein n=1 Tax=Popillia japonica TaxID=7064 RepID=A0AAW1KHR3_POPJA